MSAVESPICNAAAYKFVRLEDLPALRQRLIARSGSLGLRGTILLSPEGINLFIAGAFAAIEQFLAELREIPELADLEVKLSPSDSQPFTRMLVRLKREIIALGRPEIQPENYTSRKISAGELKSALDGGEDLLLLDVRNDYEVELGTFDAAVPIGLDHFRNFPEAAARLPEEWRQKKIVMFCTGGIRCEKAGPMMERLGFANVLQLEGGILKYFEEVGAEHYRGDCFVFDKRVAVDPELRETTAGLCYACQAVLSETDQGHPQYVPGKQCPHCYQPPEQTLIATIGQREAELQRLTASLPGKGPYDSVRPLNVPAKYDQLPLVEMLCRWHDHLPREYWAAECAEGRLRIAGVPLSAAEQVRSGMRIEHLLPGTSEPDVATDVRWIYEDQQLVVLNKPAPLPVHPCGRFNRNSLTFWLNQMYGQQKLRPAHRLDANTSGLILFSRTKETARIVQPQFESGSVAKTYLALVAGEVSQAEFACTLPIGTNPGPSGGRCIDRDDGQPARTEFRRLSSGEYSLLECRPLSGRTNQIRIHLHALGYPIVGDPVYNAEDCPPAAEPAATLRLDSSPMCLHAWKLSLIHPQTKLLTTFEAPPPGWAEWNSSGPPV